MGKGRKSMSMKSKNHLTALPQQAMDRPRVGGLIRHQASKHAKQKGK